MAAPLLLDPWPPPTPLADVVYPESDGTPMAETDVHARCIMDVRTMLDAHFAADPDVYISGNIFLYYEEGNPRETVAPDVLVVRGVNKRLRRTYKLWEEGTPPGFVLEVSSPSTRWEDLATKRGLYELLGVQEYVLFDPLREYLKPALQGFRLENGTYRPIPVTTPSTDEASDDASDEASEPVDDLALWSETLGLELHTAGDRLRLFDRKHGLYLRTLGEEAGARRTAEARAQQAEGRVQQAEGRAQREATARTALEAEIASLRAELARHTTPPGST